VQVQEAIRKAKFKQGKSNRQIAVELGISRNTVKKVVSQKQVTIPVYQRHAFEFWGGIPGTLTCSDLQIGIAVFKANKNPGGNWDFAVYANYEFWVYPFRMVLVDNRV